MSNLKVSMEDEKLKLIFMKNNSKIIDISFSILIYLIFGAFFFLGFLGLILRIIETPLMIIPLILIGCIIVGLTFLKFKLWKKSKLPIEENKDLKYCTNLIGGCLFISLIGAIMIMSVEIFDLPKIGLKGYISFLILFVFSTITYLSLIKMRKTTLLYVNSFFILLGLCLIGWFLPRIQENLNTPITSFDPTNPILIFILFCLLFAYVFKGIMISFTPSFRRYFKNQKIRYFDVLIVTLLSFGFIVSIIFENLKI